jgi:glutamate carboxypeptidase
MAHFVIAAQAITNYDLGTTVNVGTIKGGEAKNTVPDVCEVEVDFRFTTTAEADNAEQALLRAARQAEVLVPGAKLVVSGGKGRLPLERTEASASLFERYAAEAAISGGSDASTTSAIGIASIDGLGPRGTGFHTKDENAAISSLVPKALALATFLSRYAVHT